MSFRKITILLSIILLLLVFSLSLQVSSEPILVLDFEDVSTGALPEVFSVVGGTPSVTDEIGVGSSKKSLRIKSSLQPQTWGDYVVSSFVEQKSKTTIEFSFYTDATEMSLVFGAFSDVLTAYEAKNAAFYLSARTGKLQCFDGAWHDVCEVEPETWYRIKLVIDPEAQGCDIYVDDMETPKITGAGFRNPADKISAIAFSVLRWNDDGGIYYIDDLQVFGTIDSTEEGQNVFLIVEAEDFDTYGSWTFVPEAGISGKGYLIGRFSKGASLPEDASIILNIPEDGKYQIWVRSRDYTQNPGTRFFRIGIGNQGLPTLFGTHGRDGWGWQSLDTPMDLKEGPLKLRLIDGSQNYARVDALILTTDLDFTPPTSIMALSTSIEKAERVIPMKEAEAFLQSMPVVLSEAVDVTDYPVISSHVIQNDRIKIEFKKIQGEDGFFIARELYLAGEDGWVECDVTHGIEGFLVLRSDSENIVEDLSYRPSQFPKWRREIELNLDDKVSKEKFDTPNSYYAGEPLWAIADHYEIIDERTIRTISDRPDFKLMAEWNLAEGSDDPIVKFYFTPKTKGYYSIAFTGFPEWQIDEIEFLLLPYMWLSKRLPQESYLNLEAYSPTPVALVNKKSADGTLICYGLAVDPNEIPNRWAYQDNSRFGLSIRDPIGNVKPALFAPVLGTPESKFDAGETYSFNFHYMVREGNWFEGYRHVVEDIFKLSDYRKNWEGSLTDAIFNLTDLMMHDDAGGWDLDAKGPYNIESRNTVTHSAPLIPLEMYLLTGDEEIYNKRALPTMEYLLSRPRQHFALLPGGIYGTSDMGGPVASYGTSVYGGFFKATRGLSPVFQEIALGSGPRAYDPVPYWNEELWTYLFTGEEQYLDNAKKHAEQYIKDEIFGPKTVDLGEQQSFINVQSAPYWPALIDLYEVTGDEKYLEAAEEGARWLMTFIWTQPVVPDDTITTSQSEMLKRGILTPVFKGKEDYRLGSDLINELIKQEESKTGLSSLISKLFGSSKEQMSLEETVPAWVVSKVGLGLETPWTYTQHQSANVLMSNWAPDLLRLAHYTGNELYRTYARNAVIGRFNNYPGYYLGHFNTIHMKSDYPYEGPDYTNIYYHHIYPHLGFALDFLVTEAWDLSNGAIEFPYVRQQGYVWFNNRVYGFEPGKFFDDTGVWLWLKRGLVQIDNIQINYLTACKDGIFYIALMNEDDSTNIVKVTISDEIIGREAEKIEVFIADERGKWIDGKSLFKGSLNNALEVEVPAKGIRGIKLEGADVSEPVIASILPEEVSPNPEGSSFVNLSGKQGDVHGAIFMVDPSYYDAYVYITAKPDALSTAILHYNIGSGWISAVDDSFPFEFTIRVDDPNTVFEFFLETVDKGGMTQKTGTYKLAPPKVKIK